MNLLNGMNLLKNFLMISSVAIYAVTISAILKGGINWPAIYFGDLLKFGWRSQFNTDFLIHLVLLATWIAWREKFSAKGYLYAFLSIFMGGLFSFPYLAYAIHKAQGDPHLVFRGQRK